MEEEEHEVYGGDIPVEGDMEGDMEGHGPDVDMSAADDDAVKVFSRFIQYFYLSDFLFDFILKFFRDWFVNCLNFFCDSKKP